jgi:hypothetical protein
MRSAICSSGRKEGAGTVVVAAVVVGLSEVVVDGGAELVVVDGGTVELTEEAEEVRGAVDVVSGRTVVVG